MRILTLAVLQYVSWSPQFGASKRSRDERVRAIMTLNAAVKVKYLDANKLSKPELMEKLS